MGETFLVDAKKTRSKWVFRDRSIWEVRWYPAAWSARLAARAEKETSRTPSERSKRPKAA